ncbi:hypothetical protein T01_2527, partial [Trichinella spiralis]
LNAYFCMLAVNGASASGSSPVMVQCFTSDEGRAPFIRRIEKVKFGVPASEAFAHDIPATLLVLLLRVNKLGPLKKDIWRAPGNQAHVRKLIHIMQHGRLVNIDNFSVYTAASVIKKFLSKLSGGIFGVENEERLFESLEIQDTHKRREAVCRVLSSLSVPCQHLLVLLFGTFRLITDAADSSGTRMNPEVIGLSVAPSLFHTCIHDGQRARVEDVIRFRMASRVVTFVVEHFGFSNLFPRENYEFYARITGRTLRVEANWHFSFHYPSNLVESNTADAVESTKGTTPTDFAPVVMVIRSSGVDRKPAAFFLHDSPALGVGLCRSRSSPAKFYLGCFGELSGSLNNLRLPPERAKHCQTGEDDTKLWNSISFAFSAVAMIFTHFSILCNISVRKIKFLNANLMGKIWQQAFAASYFPHFINTFSHNACFVFVCRCRKADLWPWRSCVIKLEVAFVKSQYIRRLELKVNHDLTKRLLAGSAYSQPDVATTSHSVESSHDYDCLRSLNLACNAVSLDELKELNQLAAVAKSPSYLEWVHERQTLRMQTRSEWFLSPIITTGEKINGGFCSRSIDAAMNKALLARRNSRNRSDLARRRSFRTHHVRQSSASSIFTCSNAADCCTSANLPADLKLPM